MLHRRNIPKPRRTDECQRSYRFQKPLHTAARFMNNYVVVWRPVSFRDVNVKRRRTAAGLEHQARCRRRAAAYFQTWNCSCFWRCTAHPHHASHKMCRLLHRVLKTSARQSPFSCNHRNHFASSLTVLSHFGFASFAFRQCRISSAGWPSSLSIAILS